jgi:pimeloyl-ACP methyl ester carboxylesterase
MPDNTYRKERPMETITSGDGTTIAFDRVGEGPPVVLVGGAFSYRKFPGLVQLTGLLAERFTVINYDRRGRGDSGDTKPYAIEREIEDLAAVIEAAGGSAYAWGLSSGAALALDAAARGLNIEKLALYEPPFVAEAGGPRPPANAEAELNRLIAKDRRGEAVRYYMREMFGAPAAVVAVMRLLPVWKRLKAVANTLPYDVAIMGDFSIPIERAASVATPTLVVGGEKSDPRLRHAVRELASSLPNGQLRMLEGQSHNVSMKALAPVLTEFFAAQNGSRLGSPSNA